ncbi:hypothetical protein U9M48_014885 [Paspalum notatum var. saurae]|uniref:FAD-dependent oxidoreductase domain-containing protein 1 n=1 Tax=Paspalum notatum var. saurae TaxID=547442 RepID=A0AAQ3T438_PASNO
MDAAIAFTSAPNPSPTRFSPSSASLSSRAPQSLSVCGPRRGRGRPLRALRPQSQAQAPAAAASDAAANVSHHDVVVVGAGIVGLAIARHLLLHTPLSVAVVDAAVPCSGATGAGQGYIWMSHRTPGSDMWELAVRSKQLWEELAAEVDSHEASGARERLGWMRTVPDGKPVIDFIPDLANVLIATGHEGNGLTMALGTAEMVTDMILGNSGKVDRSTFSIKHRFSVSVPHLKELRQ